MVGEEHEWLRTVRQAQTNNWFWEIEKVTQKQEDQQQDQKPLEGEHRQ